MNHINRIKNVLGKVIQKWKREIRPFLLFTGFQSFLWKHRAQFSDKGEKKAGISPNDTRQTPDGIPRLVMHFLGDNTCIEGFIQFVFIHEKQIMIRKENQVKVKIVEPEYPSAIPSLPVDDIEITLDQLFPVIEHSGQYKS